MEKDGRSLDKPTLSGSWTDRVVANMPDGSQWTLFETKPVPSGPNRCGINVSNYTMACQAHDPKQQQLTVLSMAFRSQACRKVQGLSGLQTAGMSN